MASSQSARQPKALRATSILIVEPSESIGERLEGMKLHLTMALTHF